MYDTGMCVNYVFSQGLHWFLFLLFFPDYQDRIARHGSALFLVAYLTGLSIMGYSLDIGKEHVNLADEQLQKFIYTVASLIRKNWTVAASSSGLQFNPIITPSLRENHCQDQKYEKLLTHMYKFHKVSCNLNVLVTEGLEYNKVVG